ncbi:MAG: hypothetical protein AB7O74_03515 [Candidatus Nanopelagicales bacterium]
MSDDWQTQRREAADALAERAARNRAIEVAKARELVAGFVAEARNRGLRTVPLLVRAGDSRDTYTCGLVGWYLRRDGSLGIAEDGEMYVLSAPKSLRARFRGVTLAPDEPRLQAGIGGRDGESIALATLLELRLAAGDDWPIVR